MNTTRDQIAAWLVESRDITFGMVDQAEYVLKKALGDLVPLEIWNGVRKVTIYPDSVLRSWGINIDTEMSDEPRTQQAIQDALAWLYESAPQQPVSAEASLLQEAADFIRSYVDCYGSPAATELLSRMDAALSQGKQQAEGAREGCGHEACDCRSYCAARVRAEAIEQCAKACEAMHEEDRPGDYAYACRSLASEGADSKEKQG